MKYKTFGEFIANLKVGDLITLSNGTVLTVRDITHLYDLKQITALSSHNALEAEYDLLYLFEHGKLINYIDEPEASDTNEDVKPEIINEILEKPSSLKQERKITYGELFQMMESADKTSFKYSRYFWQYTHIDNLKEILKSGKFQSRHNLEGKIPFNIKEYNDTANHVMNTNLSWRLKHHVRFYLRPTNAPFFSAKNSLKNEDDLVYIAITKDALYRSNTSTFLFPRNAHSATNSDLEKEHELNRKYGEPFVVRNLELFNFEETYSLYDKKQFKERKNFQQAEFLVWKDLPTTFIEFIFFKSKPARENFLNSIINLPCYNGFKDKCLVNGDLFYAKGYK